MQLSVATWNVLADCYVTPELYPRTPLEFLPPGSRTASIVGNLQEMVNRLRLDAVCLQEVDRSLLTELHRASRRRAWRVLSSWEVEATRDQCAVLLCGDWTLGTHDYLSYAQAPGYRVQRLVLLSGVTAAVLYNTHFRWAADNGCLTGAQSAELALWVDREDYPTIVAGDLNSTPDSPALQQLFAIGLKDLHPYESLRTAEFRHTGPIRLDYILLRGAQGKPLLPTDIIIDGKEPLPGWRCPSDHVPLAACVSVPTRRAIKQPQPPQVKPGIE